MGQCLAKPCQREDGTVILTTGPSSASASASASSATTTIAGPKKKLAATAAASAQLDKALVSPVTISTAGSTTSASAPRSMGSLSVATVTAATLTPQSDAPFDSTEVADDDDEDDDNDDYDKDDDDPADLQTTSTLSQSRPIRGSGKVKKNNHWRIVAFTASTPRVPVEDVLHECDDNIKTASDHGDGGVVSSDVMSKPNSKRTRQLSRGRFLFGTPTPPKQRVSMQLDHPAATATATSIAITMTETATASSNENDLDPFTEDQRDHVVASTTSAPSPPTRASLTVAAAAGATSPSPRSTLKHRRQWKGHTKNSNNRMPKGTRGRPGSGPSSSGPRSSARHKTSMIIPEEEDPEAPSDEEEDFVEFLEAETAAASHRRPSDLASYYDEPGRLLPVKLQLAKRTGCASPNSIVVRHNSSTTGESSPTATPTTTSTIAAPSSSSFLDRLEQAGESVDRALPGHFQKLKLQAALASRFQKKQQRVHKLEDRIQDVQEYRQLWKDYQGIQLALSESELEQEQEDDDNSQNDKHDGSDCDRDKDPPAEDDQPPNVALQFVLASTAAEQQQLQQQPDSNNSTSNRSSRRLSNPFSSRNELNKNKDSIPGVNMSKRKRFKRGKQNRRSPDADRSSPSSFTLKKSQSWYFDFQNSQFALPHAEQDGAFPTALPEDDDSGEDDGRGSKLHHEQRRLTSSFEYPGLEQVLDPELQRYLVVQQQEQQKPLPQQPDDPINNNPIFGNAPPLQQQSSLSLLSESSMEVQRRLFAEKRRQRKKRQKEKQHRPQSGHGMVDATPIRSNAASSHSSVGGGGGAGGGSCCYSGGGRGRAFEYGAEHLLLIQQQQQAEADAAIYEVSFPTPTDLSKHLMATGPDAGSVISDLADDQSLGLSTVTGGSLGTWSRSRMSRNSNSKNNNDYRVRVRRRPGRSPVWQRRRGGGGAVEVSAQSVGQPTDDDEVEHREKDKFNENDSDEEHLALKKALAALEVKLRLPQNTDKDEKRPDDVSVENVDIIRLVNDPDVTDPSVAAATTIATPKVRDPPEERPAATEATTAERLIQISGALERLQVMGMSPMSLSNPQPTHREREPEAAVIVNNVNGNSSSTIKAKKKPPTFLTVLEHASFHKRRANSTESSPSFRWKRFQPSPAAGAAAAAAIAFATGASRGRAPHTPLQQSETDPAAIQSSTRVVPSDSNQDNHDHRSSVAMTNATDPDKETCQHSYEKSGTDTLQVETAQDSSSRDPPGWAPLPTADVEMAPLKVHPDQEKEDEAARKTATLGEEYSVPQLDRSLLDDQMVVETMHERYRNSWKHLQQQELLEDEQERQEQFTLVPGSTIHENDLNDRILSNVGFDGVHEEDSMELATYNYWAEVNTEQCLTTIQPAAEAMAVPLDHDAVEMEEECIIFSVPVFEAELTTDVVETATNHPVRTTDEMEESMAPYTVSGREVYTGDSSKGSTLPLHIVSPEVGSCCVASDNEVHEMACAANDPSPAATSEGPDVVVDVKSPIRAVIPDSDELSGEDLRKSPPSGLRSSIATMSRDDFFRCFAEESPLERVARYYYDPPSEGDVNGSGIKNNRRHNKDQVGHSSTSSNGVASIWDLDLDEEAAPFDEAKQSNGNNKDNSNKNNNTTMEGLPPRRVKRQPLRDWCVPSDDSSANQSLELADRVAEQVQDVLAKYRSSDRCSRESSLDPAMERHGGTNNNTTTESAPTHQQQSVSSARMTDALEEDF